MRLLFIGAHPADLVDQAGGTIANHVEAGDEVRVVGVTKGIYSHPVEGVKVPGEMKIQFAEVKVDECKRACGFLGLSTADWGFLRYDDGPFFPIANALTLQIGLEICDFKPDILITHHPAESHHPDHAKVAQYSMEASVAAGRFLSEDLKPHKVSNIFFYGYQFHPNMVKLGHPVVPPDVVVDITGAINKKAKAFMELKSQFNTEKVVWSRLNSFEREQGRQYGFEYAETFISYQPCRTTLLPDFGKADFQSLLRKHADKE